MIEGKFVGHAVERGRGHARFDVVGEQVQRLGGQPASPAHPGKAGLAVQRNDAGGPAGLGFGVDVGDHAEGLLQEAEIVAPARF